MKIDRVIVNSAYGGWYPKGQDRLVKSLVEVGFSGDINTFCNEEINVYFDKLNPYTTKSAALYEAYLRGYKKILWLDCSIWAVKNPDTFFDIIENDGYYFMASGYNCAQTTNDHACKVSGYTHDELEKLPELWSCIFGFNLNNKQAMDVFMLFLDYCLRGVFNGSRHHNPAECSDPRFMFSRQDQTALSLAVHKNGVTKIHAPNTHVLQDAYGLNNNENTYFRMRGL